MHLTKKLKFCGFSYSFLRSPEMGSDSRGTGVSVIFSNFNLVSFQSIRPGFLPQFVKCKGKNIVPLLRERGIFQVICPSAVPLCGHNRDAVMMLGDSITFREHCRPCDLLLPKWKLVHSRLSSHRWLWLRLTWNSPCSPVRLQT